MDTSALLDAYSPANVVPQPQMKVSGTFQPQAWLVDAMGGSASTSGVRINSWTVLTCGAVWQAVTTKSGDLAAMPIDVIRTAAKRNRKEPTHVAARLMNEEAHDEMCSFEFRETMQSYSELHGNAVAAIGRDEITGEPISMTPLRPYATYLDRDDQNQLWYIHRTATGTVIPMLPHEVFHISGLGDGLWGYSVLDLMRDTVGSALAAEQYRAHQWDNNSRPSMIISKKTGKWQEEGREGFRRQWSEKHAGVSNAGRIALLSGEYETHPVMGITNEQAQLVEQLDKDIVHVGRWFRMPPYKMGILEHSSARANLEQQNQDYLQSTLIHPIVKWQQETQRKLISSHDRARRVYSIRFDTKGMLRADTAARYAAYSTAIQWGWMSPNDVNRSEELDEIVGGDFYQRPLNMAVWGPDAAVQLKTQQQFAGPATAPAAPAEVEDSDEPPEDTDAKATGRQVRMQLRLFALEQIESMQFVEREQIKRITKRSTDDREKLKSIGSFYEAHARNLFHNLRPMLALECFGDEVTLRQAITDYAIVAQSNADNRKWTEEAYNLVQSLTNEVT